MWTFRRFGKIYFFRIIVKYLFSLVFYNNRVLKIKRGPLKNYKWYCESGHQFWMPLGLYEQETAFWLENNIKKGMTFIDIGANVGYFTLLGSKCVGDLGLTISIEPIPKNIESIKTMLQINNIRNVKVESYAISDNNGTVEFAIEENTANSHLKSVDSSHFTSSIYEIIKVESIKLDDFTHFNNFKPDVIKIDVEGAEVALLQGAINVLQIHKPILIISIHSQECYIGCMNILNHLNYKIENLGGFEHEICCYPN